MTQRKIKFRAWETISQSMMSWKELLPELSRILASTKQKNVILMQYTGVKDRKGKEIYEGDILKLIKSPYAGRLHVVEFFEGAFCLCDVMDTRLHFNLAQWPGEIIGHIHDNPELLK